MITEKQAVNMVGAGWEKLIHKLYKKIDPSHITDIKEKYGQMSVYTDGAITDEEYDTIFAIEEKSSHVCEDCGAKGELREDLPWIKTLCEAHYQAKDNPFYLMSISNRAEGDKMWSKF